MQHLLKSILIDIKIIKEDIMKKTIVPDFIFGQNLEHTRACVAGGLSAQILRNRKFAGKPSRNGIALDWQGDGDNVFY